MSNSMENPWQSTITVTEEAVILKHTNIIAFGRNRGEKKVFYSDITAVEFKEPVFMGTGYIQLNVPGHICKKNGVGIDGPAFDEYSFAVDKKGVESARKIYELILENLKKSKNKSGNTVVQQALSPLDEIKKLKELADMGVISQSEFESKKEKLLSLI